MIANSGSYRAANIALMKDMKWLCRVPLTVRYAKQVRSELLDAKFNKSEIDGYSFVIKTSNYSGVEQRWLVVESEARLQSDVKQLETRISRAKKIHYSEVTEAISRRICLSPRRNESRSKISKTT